MTAPVKDHRAACGTHKHRPSGSGNAFVVPLIYFVRIVTTQQTIMWRRSWVMYMTIPNVHMHMNAIAVSPSQSSDDGGVAKCVKILNPAKSVIMEWTMQTCLLDIRKSTL